MASQSCAEGVTVIYGFADQEDLLRLFALCHKNSSLKILTPLGQALVDLTPILSLGLQDVELLSVEIDAFSAKELP
jgi:hypothetical protein